jgi:kumamolisin
VKYRAAAALVLLVSVVGAGCTTPASSGAAPARPVASSLATPPAPPLAQAIRTATRLGPAGSSTQVDLNFGLKSRQPDRLAALLAAGKTLSPGEYAAEFGPDPALVATAQGYVHAAGLSASWTEGSTLILASGPAPAASALLGIEFQSYRLADGTTFYAASGSPAFAPPLAAVVRSVTGLDNYTRIRGYAVRPGGLKAADILAFYNLNPLRKRHLDGTGETILLPEIEQIPKANLDDLTAFAKEAGLPPFDPLLTIKHATTWGTPMAAQGEAVLDLEIIHEVAPNAKLVVYQSGPQPVLLDRAFDQMVTDNLGSIISESLGVCEADTAPGHRDLFSSIQDRAQAQGMTHFVASGDNGAYTCGEDQNASASFPATLPSVTAVGGTTVFESREGLYFKETAWGSPIDESGTGGGPSQVYGIPEWQKPVADANGHGYRQVPDVAADADPITGYHIFLVGHDTQAGGTSASTPLWWATVALINQDLKAKGLREVGFANPAIYWMGANQSKFPAPPFHDITTGNNLAYSAAPGWDFTTGWGSMDADALDAAWLTYITSGGA